MSECYINEKACSRSISDRAFMGVTHATSALALFLLPLAFFPEQFTKIFNTNNVWAIVLACIVTIGFSLVPDLDNSTSTAKNTLGPLGEGASFLFRTTSAIIQTTIRTGRDDPEPNPHRGFYHTIPAALLIGFLIFLGSKIGGTLNIPYVGEISGGTLFVILVTWSCLQLTLASIGKEFTKKMKNSKGLIGEIVLLVGTLAATVGMYSQLPEDQNYWWLGVAATFGCLIHILGDLFTTAGVPIWFPIPHKGKLWWTTRLTKMKAGSWTEKMVFVPLFLVICIISSIKIGYGMF